MSINDPTKQQQQQFSSGGVTPFLAKTYELVDSPETDHIIRWSQDGESFVVLRTDLMEKELLPRKFKHAKFASFQRQLNQYSFRKTDPDTYTFTHQFFKRGRKDLLKNIQRKQSNNSSIRNLNYGQNLNLNAQNVPNSNSNLNGNQIFYVDKNLNQNLNQNQNFNQNQSSQKNNQDQQQNFSLVQQLEGLKKDKQMMTYEMDKMLQTQKNQQDQIQGLQNQVQKQDEILRSVVLFLSQGLRNPSIVQQFMMGGMGQKNQLNQLDQIQNNDQIKNKNDNQQKNGFNSSKKRRIEEEEGEDSEQSVEAVSNVQKSNQIIQYDPHYGDVFRCISQMWEQHNQQHQQQLLLEKQQNNNDNNNNTNQLWEPQQQLLLENQQKTDDNNSNYQYSDTQNQLLYQQQQLLLDNQQQKHSEKNDDIQQSDKNQFNILNSQSEQMNQQMSTLMIDNAQELSWGIPVLTTPPMYTNDIYNMHAQQQLQNMHALQPMYNVHTLQSPIMVVPNQDQMHVQDGTYSTGQVHVQHVPNTSPFKQQLSSNNQNSEIPSPMSVDQATLQNQNFSDNNFVQQNQQNQKQQLQQFINQNDGNYMQNFDNDILGLDENLNLDAKSDEEDLQGKKLNENSKDKNFLEQSLVLGDIQDQNFLDFLDINDEVFQTQDSFELNVLSKFGSQGMGLTQKN